ncbi:MAG: hypothetical protein P4L86_03340 [Mycobacterium sp.]|nr:hypothetical protein [Mycobacterium sp.]
MRDRLLSLNSPSRSWLIRDGTAEGADLVAEWKSDDPDWRQVFEDLSVALTFQVHMCLDAEKRELRVLDHLVEWRRGPEEPPQWMECHDTGDLHLSWSGNSNCLRYLITTDDIKCPIRRCVADAGWTYVLSGPAG